jgi:hypothetical protein
MGFEMDCSFGFGFGNNWFGLHTSSPFFSLEFVDNIFGCWFFLLLVFATARSSRQKGRCQHAAIKAVIFLVLSLVKISLLSKPLLRPG